MSEQMPTRTEWRIWCVAQTRDVAPYELIGTAAMGMAVPVGVSPSVAAHLWNMRQKGFAIWARRGTGIYVGPRCVRWCTRCRVRPVEGRLCKFCPRGYGNARRRGGVGTADPLVREMAEVRLTRNVKMEQLAAHLGVARQTIRDWVTGKASPKSPNRRAIRRWLFDGGTERVAS